MFTYLQFLLKSTNEHAVHSPFVFNYITKGIYKSKLVVKNNKSLTWLLRSVVYFNDITFFYQNLTKDFDEIKTATSISNAKIIVEEYQSTKIDHINGIIQNLKNDQILLLILNNYPKSFMNNLRANKDLILVVDFYYGCLISKRTEQPKQNFYIRF